MWYNIAMSSFSALFPVNRFYDMILENKSEVGGMETIKCGKFVVSPRRDFKRERNL